MLVLNLPFKALMFLTLMRPSLVLRSEERFSRNAEIGRAVQQECRDRKSGSAGMPRPISYAVFCLKKKIIGGVVVGLLSGLFGVGGVFLIVQLFLALSPISMAQAVNTSLMVIALVSSSGFISHLLLSEQNNVSLLALVVFGKSEERRVGKGW